MRLDWNDHLKCTFAYAGGPSAARHEHGVRIGGHVSNVLLAIRVLVVVELVDTHTM